MEQNKSWWQEFNPSLKEMMDKNPNITILRIWWAMTWRLYAIVGVSFLALAILAKLFS